VSIADSATGSPQTVTLTGYGPGSSTLTLSLVTEPTGGFTSVYSLIAAATKTIDMTMYENTDTTATADLIAAGKAGIIVRVILDTNGEHSNNTTSYNSLNGATNVSVTWANTSFADTHEKSIIIDAAVPAKAQAGIFTANLSSQYYASSRDFLLYENDPNDVAAMETTFNSDFTNGQSCAAAKGCTYSPSGYTPPTGDDLVWSPTNARTAIASLIASATKTIVLDEEEMADSGMASALEAAAGRGVTVKCAITTSEGTASLLTAMKAAGITIAEYPGSGTELYIHAKVIIVDYGTSNEQAFLGSENFSSNSLNNNRELGLIFNDSSYSNAQSTISALNTVLQADVACTSDSSCKFY
jgi:phosphatidylserine/phosphatidylglycerophosphate/cardiolipin synthase-like enzyme